ncbi:SusC/RagA family TonB-linked outer membrane protein [Puteibacter caeruleilacunae]|nr:SusC/RagA family TonB-linked outer membrane protein [Puteibacter caeruleilacunae]
MKKFHQKAWNRYAFAKILRVMRISVFLVLLSVLQVHAISTYSQKQKLTLDFKNTRIEEVLERIEEKSEYFFLYNEELIDIERRVDIRVENQSIGDVLKMVFDQAEVKAMVIDKQIILSPVGNRNAKQALQLLKKIKGKVTDENGESLPGVSVVVKGTTVGITTDLDGNYSLDLPERAETLVFSFVGMTTQEIAINAQATINVTLKTDAIGLEEVVAIGYGTKSKSTLTGAVGVVDKKQLQSRPTSKTTDLLQGAVAGVQVTRSNSGRLKGTNSSISIRGLTSRSNPGVLIVIDGIAQKDNNTYALDNINPNDIESISVLKDAQAAIYGARAAGGVMLITTKKGKLGKPKIEFSANFNLQVPDLMKKGTNIMQLVEMQNEAWQNDGQMTNMYSHIVKYIEDNNLTFDKVKQNTGEHVIKWPFDDSANFVFGHYDWSEIMWDPALSRNYNVTVSGKSDKANYYSSVGYVDQDGMLAFGDNYNKRLFVKLKGEYDLTDYLKVRSIFDFERQDISEPSSYGSLEFWQGLIWPVFMDYNKEGHLYNFGSHQNPIGYARDSGNSTDLNYRVKGMVAVDVTPVKGLKITGEVSNSYDIRENEWTKLGFDMYNENDKYSYNSTNNRNSAGASYGRSRYVVANLFANYKLTLADKHKVNFMGGYSHEEEDYRYFDAYRKLGSISHTLPTFGVGSAEEQYNGERKTDVALRSYFSRVDYNYQDKYLLEGTFRYDGSSRFADGHKWAPFWGISGAWTVSNEGFFKNVKGIDFLKIRSSWGQMGNQASIGLYDHISQINLGGNYPMGNPLSPVQTQKATLGGMPSTTRSWEKIETTNLGVDFGILDSRLSGSIDLFVKNNKNMFFSKEFPQVLGVSAPSINGAHVRTKGWELKLGWKENIGEFNYFANLNLSNSTNKVVALEENAVPRMGGNSFIEGLPVGTYYGYKFDGFIETEEELAAYKEKFTAGIPNGLKLGDAKYKDLDGDGKLEALSYEVGSDGQPAEMSGDMVQMHDWGQYNLFGITIGGSWKNLDFSAFFQGVLKWYVFESSKSIDHWSWVPHDYFYNDTWRPDRMNATYPRLAQNDGVRGYNYTISDAPYKQFNNRYIRLKNLQVGYTVPKRIVNKLKMDNVRVYFSGTDILELHNLPGTYDPEKPFNPRISPMPRGFSLGINLTL